mgnify:CR=1 FL=1
MAVDRPMLDFVKATIEREDPTASELDTQYPFRKRFDHCYRTFRWAQRINLIEGADADTVEIAALFHDAAKAERHDVLVICHGGPIAEPEDAAYILEHTEGVVGFYGASSVERLPTERAITGQVESFKALKL